MKKRPTSRVKPKPAASPKVPTRAPAAPANPIPHHHAHTDQGVQEPIHHHERDLTILQRWYAHAKDRPGFWGWVVFLAALPIVVVIAMNYFGGGESKAVEGWRQLATAQGNLSELEEIASNYKGQPVEPWVLLQIGDEAFRQGVNSLPGNTETAEASLQTALERYEKVLKIAPADSTPAQNASYGLARTLEARGDLDAAIEAYQAYAKRWPNTPEAKLAQTFAERLAKPAARTFYKKLYAFKPALEPPTDAPITVPPPPGTESGTGLPPLPDMTDADRGPFPKTLPQNPFQESSTPAELAPPALIPPAEKAATPPEEQPELPSQPFNSGTP